MYQQNQNKMKKILFLFIVLLLSTCLMAQSDQERGHSPNSGIFLSMSLGPSYLSINDDITGSDFDNMTFKGVGIVFDFQIGAPIKENFVLHGDIVSSSSGKVDITIDGEAAGTLDGENSIGMMMFGGGFTYYAMPSNVFFTAVLGVGGFTMTIEDETGNTQKGLGLFCKAGKEWYLSSNWDLGFNINLNYTNVTNEADSMTEKLSGFSIGLGLNATFN